jgi:hypothetical protein
MTNKKFVLSIYPTAYSENTLINNVGWGIFDRKTKMLLSAYEFESTATIAWKHAAEVILQEMLEKFES